MELFEPHRSQSRAVLCPAQGIFLWNKAREALIWDYREFAPV